MAYTTTNFKTKKALKEAIARGDKVITYQPGPFSANHPREGQIALEGPHYPEPHRWYATGILKDGVLVSVK